MPGQGCENWEKARSRSAQPCVCVCVVCVCVCVCVSVKVWCETVCVHCAAFASF